MACPDCFSGAIHEGTPKGKIVKLHGLDTYIAEPPASTPSKGVIVILPDAFGMQFLNNQLLADSFVEKGGYKVYLPDFFKGSPAPEWLIDSMVAINSMPWYATLHHVFWVACVGVPWLIGARPSKTYPIVKPFFQALRAPGSPDANSFIGAAGYCWGGKHAVLLANATEASYMPTGETQSRPLIDAGFAAHPSALTLPADIEAMNGVPVSFALPEKDEQIGEKERKVLGEAVEKNGRIDGEVRVYEGCGHGFAVRADFAGENKKEIEHAVEAEEQCLKWFDAHLKR